MISYHFQLAALAPKVENRLGGFLSHPGLILGVDSNCSGGGKKRLGCVKKLQNRIKSKFPGGYVWEVIPRYFQWVSSTVG